MEATIVRGLYAAWARTPSWAARWRMHSFGRGTRHFEGDLPTQIARMKKRFMSTLGWTPNALMLNAYTKGAEVPWHLDDQVQRLAVVSFGGDAVFGYGDRGDVPEWQVEWHDTAPEEPEFVTLRHGDLIAFDNALDAVHSVRNFDDRTSLVFRQYVPDTYHPTHPIW